MRTFGTGSKLLIVLGAAALATTPLAAAGASSAADNAKQRTYHRDIEPLFQKNCQGCHRPDGLQLGGMIAPMPLTTYDEVRPWARAIAKKVAAKEMPPWFAGEEFHGVFANERTLTDEQIAMVADWVAAGAPAGDPADAPPPKEWNDYEGWSIGKPDLVLDLVEPFWIEDGVRDLNISLKAEAITAEMLPEPRWIEAVEFRPGSDAVHHIIGSTRSASAEDAGATGMFGAIAPGTEPFRLPEGFGRLLVPGTQVFFQMHYNKEPGPGSGRFDRSQVAFKFKPKDEVIERVAQWDAIGNRDFEIPPGAENWEVGASRIFEHESTIFALLPHMHLRGKYAKYVAHYPDGTQETLLEVPWYDWNWQTNYEFAQPKVVPAGTRIEVTMYFDNTAEREELIRAGGTEIDSTIPVRFGGPTYMEMMLGFLDYSYNIPREEFGAVGHPAGTAGGR
jgi:mono/diheme cytochrome c family protein